MENLRGSLLMTAAMLGFAIEDMFIKMLTATVPLGMVLALLGAGGAMVFTTLALLRGDRLISADLLARSVLIRNLGELIGTVGFITAIALTPLSSASAILQATPLVVTLGAALFLGEQVGWRRWSAILAGFAGVLLIIRPGLDAFEPFSLFAVMGVIGLALRDLATRTVPRAITSLQLSAYAFAITVPAGFGILAFTGDSVRMPTAGEGLLLAAAMLCAVLAYSAIVAAMRMGDVAVITPFRYSRLVFALIFGVAFFGESPDVATLTGSALIVASGIYTFWREARLRRLAARA
ncbi:MAG: DMT family transporter [Rhodobacterales bacterium]